VPQSGGTPKWTLPGTTGNVAVTGSTDKTASAATGSVLPQLSCDFLIARRRLRRADFLELSQPGHRGLVTYAIRSF
jgi:hypothetical protein